MDQSLRRDLLHYSLYEAGTACVLLLLYAGFMLFTAVKPSFIWTAPLMLLVLLLLEGSFYWYICYKRLRDRSKKYTWIARLYRFLRVFNGVYSGIYPLTVLLFYIGREEDIYYYLGALIFLVALLEYTDKFFIRLYYSPRELISRIRTRRFKRSKISREIYKYYGGRQG